MDDWIRYGAFWEGDDSIGSEFQEIGLPVRSSMKLEYPVEEI
jgi:hypothetical protein